MPTIAGVATALPEHKMKQEDVKSFAREIFGSRPAIEKLLTVFDNSLIEERYFAPSMEWFQTAHTFGEVNDFYIEQAVALTSKAIGQFCDITGIGVAEFDAVIFISTTGLATPSIDAHLFNKLGFDRHIKRLPIWGLGCAGGAAGISRAFDHAKAYPKSKVLVLSLELCGLAFQPKDRDKSNIIATALFSDGAAACCVVGDEVPLALTSQSHPVIVDTLSTIYPDTMDVMGWHISDDGFKVVLSRDIPTIVRSLVYDNIGELLQKNELSYADLSHYVAHPGGRKVLEAYSEALGITEADLQHSYGVLRDHGNMSSATVFFILKRFMERSLPTGSFGLLSALGPGFSSELVLLRW